MQSASSSLVKYNTPMMVQSTSLNKSKNKTLKQSTENKLTSKEDILNSILPPRLIFILFHFILYLLYVLPLIFISKPTKIILLYREWTENGQLWVQYVSSTPSTRLDVVNLQEKLDHFLQLRQARETGICPIREELYSQCFGIVKL